MNLEELKQGIENNEYEYWQIVQNMRASVRDNLGRYMNEVRVNDREHAVKRAIRVIQDVYQGLDASGAKLLDLEPGHGPGHLVREFISAWRIARRSDLDPTEVFLGQVAGSLHDIGLLLMPRYEEVNRVVRHGEAGALLLAEVVKEQDIDLTRGEHLLLMFAIAAHTHYLKPMTVECRDGVERLVEPYEDLLIIGSKPGEMKLGTGDSDEAFYPVWLTRQADRLDCVGPQFLGRHYLTTADEHKDYGQDGFYDVKYQDHMRPVLRTNENRGRDGRTMLEHFSMFAESQSNRSIYGRFDEGEMVIQRNALRAMSRDIIGIVLEAKKREMSQPEQDDIRMSWTEFLGKTVEPSDRGQRTAMTLDSMFSKLNEDVQRIWCHGFKFSMGAYCDWAEVAMAELGTLNPKQRKLPGICTDVREFIKPDDSWLKVISQH